MASRALVLAFSLLIILPNSLAHPNHHHNNNKDQITYHGGQILKGRINIILLWYGNVEESTKITVRSFFDSINLPKGQRTKPTVGNWWKVIQSYQKFASPKPATVTKTTISIAKESAISSTTMGQVLTDYLVGEIVTKAAGLPNSIVVIITAKDVTVQGLCTGTCNLHGVIKKTNPYIVVGNSEIECPDLCLWPFRPSPYMPGGKVFKSPSKKAADDSIVMHLAKGLAETVVNPSMEGFYGGNRYKPIEISEGVCKNVFGKRASLAKGDPGNVAVDEDGRSYNAIGKNGVKFLLPSVWNPKSRRCYTLM